MPVGRFDSDMSTALIKMTGISRRVRLFHRLRQNAQPSMIGIIRSRRMNVGAVGNVVRALSASSPCRAPTVANPASSRRSQRASLIASSSSTTRTRGTSRFCQRGRVGAFGVAHDSAAAGTTVERADKGTTSRRCTAGTRPRLPQRSDRRPPSERQLAAASLVVVRVASVAAARTNRLARRRN